MKHFTVDEANEALRTVRPIAEQLAGHNRELERCRDELATVQRAVGGNGGRLDPGRVGALRRAADASAAAVGRCIEEIQALGAQVKDVERALVDFPARHPAGGETVLLCWHPGEDEIRYWHGTDEGFAGRKPLPF